jgi:branched-chain amino acid aminotransferase
MAQTWFGNENYDPDPNVKVWMNGKLVSAAEASVNVFDHGLLYGDGVFEGIRVYNGKVFERIAHLRRLYDSANAIRLQIPYDIKQLSDALDETLKANDLLEAGKESYIRLLVTRGVGVLGISPMRTWKPMVIIIAARIEMYSKEMYENGMAVIISSYTRNHPNAMPPRIKSLNYLNNILGKIEAHDAGVGEAIMLNHMGFVGEATGDNVFIVRDGQILTPHTASGLLAGITRATVIRLARQEGIELEEKNLERMDLYSCDEMFLTGTGAELIPVTRIDNRTIGTGRPGPITKKLMELYRKHVREAEDIRP